MMHPPSSLMDSTVNPKMKTTEGERVGACPLACSTLGVERRVGAMGWGLGRLTSKSIIHTNLHKPNDKLLSVQLKHLWCTNEPQANTGSQDSPRPELGASHHLPPYSILCVGHGTNTQMSFCLGTLKWEFRNSQKWDSRNFGGP